MSQMDKLNFLGEVEFEEAVKFAKDVEVTGSLKKDGKEILTGADLSAPDWNQNDPAASDYIQNRTHYDYTIKISVSDPVLIELETSWYACFFRNVDENIDFTQYPEGTELNVVLTEGSLSNKITGTVKVYSTHIGNPYLSNDEANDNGEPFSIWNNGKSWVVNFKAPVKDYESGSWNIEINVPSLVKQLDEKYIPISIARTNGIVRSAAYDSQGNHIADTYAKKSEITDLFTPIDIMAELGAKDVSWNWYDDNWPKTDEDIVNMLTTVTANNQWPDDLFIKLFSLFETYPGILPAFGFFPKASGHGCKYKLTCSTERVEIDSYQETGSTIHPDFNFTYFINLSKDNYLELRFNYNSPDETAIDWDNINLDNLYLTFNLVPKGGNITTEQVAKLAQEQIITPILTKEEF